MANCLLGIVGVTEKETIPFYADLETELQDSIAESSSGLYLDELPGGIDLMAVDDETYMPQVLQLGVDACKKASKDLYADLLVAINNRFHPAKTNFNGLIGRKTVSATSSSAGEIQGQRYRMNEPIAGLITITKIELQVNGSGAFNVYISRCDAKSSATEELLYTFPVTSVANTWVVANISSATNGIKLPMEIDGVPQEYYVYWKRSESGGFYPKNNEIKCGTCGNNANIDALAGFMQYNGVSISGTDNLFSANTDKAGHGLAITAQVSCDHESVVCREYEKKQAVKLMIEKAAQNKAGELWIEYIFKSGYVNRDNMQNREYLWGKRNHFRKEYEERITAIANTMELGETNCYICKDTPMTKGTIFS